MCHKIQPNQTEKFDVLFLLDNGKRQFNGFICTIYDNQKIEH